MIDSIFQTIQYYPWLTIILLLAMSALILLIYIHSIPYFMRFRGIEERSVLWGLSRCVLLNPHEGFIVMRGTKTIKVIPSKQTPVNSKYIFISPVRNEQIRYIVRLSPQNLTWRDISTLTANAIPVGLKISLLWKINDVEKFVFGLGQDVGIPLSQAKELSAQEINARIDWIKNVVENTIHDLAAHHINIKDLIANTTSHQDSNIISTQFKRRLHKMVASELKDYGIGIETMKVSLESLPPGISRTSEDLLRTSLRPLEAQYEIEAENKRKRWFTDNFGEEATHELYSFKKWTQSIVTTFISWIRELLKDN